MRKYLAIVLAGLSLNLVSASAFADDTAPAQQGTKEWTFLVYLNGHNNLDSYGATNIKQMEKVGSTKDVNIVVQWASAASSSTKRVYVTKSTNPATVTSPTVQDMGKVDMGDWRNIVEFVKWANVNYPAKHYFLNVWDHGSGWHALQIQARGGEVNPTDISWDDDSGNSITTQQLGMALAESAKVIGHKIDVYGSDACLMAMAEVANELSDNVAVYAGSEEVEPAAGWPYDQLLQAWTAKPTMSGLEVAKTLTTEYVKSYSGGQNGTMDVTFSAFDLSKMAQFNTAISALGSKLMKLDAPARKKVVQAAMGTQNFTYDDYGDLGDFLSHVEQSRIVDTGAINGARSAMGDFVIANQTTDRYAKAKGVAIWLPSNMDTFKNYVDKYRALQFNNGTKWADALQFILQDATPQ
jgi:hypothetical protein